MNYQLSEDTLTGMLMAAYRSGARGQDNPNALIEAMFRQHRADLGIDEASPSPVGYHWETIMSPDMMAACDEETFIQEMGVPPPVVIGSGPAGPYTPWRDINGTFRRRRHE